MLHFPLIRYCSFHVFKLQLPTTICIKFGQNSSPIVSLRKLYETLSYNNDNSTQTISSFYKTLSRFQDLRVYCVELSLVKRHYHSTCNIAQLFPTVVSTTRPFTTFYISQFINPARTNFGSDFLTFPPVGILLMYV